MKKGTLTSDYRARLDSKEKELILHKGKVRDFVLTDHKARDTKKYLKDLAEAEAELNKIMISLLELKTMPQFKAEAEKLCSRCRKLNDSYIRNMNKALSDDLNRNQSNLLQNAGFFVGLVVGFAASVKNGVGNNAITVNEAAGAGGAVGLLIIFRKRIAAKFKAAGRAVCETPQDIKNSYLLFWTRQTIREKKNAAQKSFKDGTQELTAKIHWVGSKAKTGKQRLLGRGGPAP